MSSEESKKEKKSGKKKNPTEDFPIQEYRLIPTDSQESRGSEEDEIDLLEIIRTIWDNRKTIYKFVTVGTILGVLIVLLSPKEFVSSAKLMPEYSTESQSGASSLLQQYGGLIGLSGGGSYNSSSNAIRVDLYPEIVQSLTFQQKLANHDFYFPEEDTIASFYEYYTDIRSPNFFETISDNTIGLPKKLIKILFSDQETEFSSKESINNEIISISREQMQIIIDLRLRVNASLDDESGIISVNAKMTNPVLAANVAKYTIDELTSYLIEYRTEKVLRDLKFIEEQLIKAESRFNEAQAKLADFRDSNQGTLTAKARTEEQRLNSDYDLAFSLYNSFTQQFEEARLKVQEETPVFKMLQPVQVPVNDETNGAKLVFVFVLLSIISSITMIILKPIILKIFFNRGN